jgi:hypothetical protein
MIFPGPKECQMIYKGDFEGPRPLRLAAWLCGKAGRCSGGNCQGRKSGCKGRANGLKGV